MVEHLLPRSRGGRDGAQNLLPACRACNRARRSQPAVAYVRKRTADGAVVMGDLLVRGLERLAAHGAADERRYGAKQARLVREWQAGGGGPARPAPRPRQ